MTFTEELRASGAMVAGDGLRDTDAATTVRVRDGETRRTDGPFAATDEELSGYELGGVANLDAAVAWAAKVPGASYASVEVRLVRVFHRPRARRHRHRAGIAEQLAEHIERNSQQLTHHEPA
jgi:hypothetical protein